MKTENPNRQNEDAFRPNSSNYTLRYNTVVYNGNEIIRRFSRRVFRKRTRTAVCQLKNGRFGRFRSGDPRRLSDVEGFCLFRRTGRFPSSFEQTDNGGEVDNRILIT
jgi:hypothetical protein